MLKKNRKLPIIVGGLAAVALLSVGFSSWLVGTQTTGTTGNVSVTVGDVHDARLKLVIDSAATSSSLVFDANNETSAGYISKGTNSEDESLDMTVKFTIGFDVESSGNSFNGHATKMARSVANIEDQFAKIKFEWIATAKGTEFNTAMANNAIGAQPFDVSTVDTTTVYSFEWNKADVHSTYDTDVHKIDITAPTTANNGIVPDANTYTVTAVFHFNYGSFFNYQNPVKFEPTAEKTLDQAITNLETLHNVSTGTFDLKISTLAA